mmetsp:Transcript_26711/g.61483  ORF Transcript_26711/g.61483 Transcript_26711/m.61483 type:complete len:836 (-) Transcript_26711:40-2547(-)
MVDEDIPENFHFNAESDDEHVEGLPEGGKDSAKASVQQSGSTAQTSLEVRAPTEPPSGRGPPRFGRRHQPAAEQPVLEVPSGNSSGQTSAPPSVWQRSEEAAPTDGLVPATSLLAGHPKSPEPAIEDNSEKPPASEPALPNVPPPVQEPSRYSDMPLFGEEPIEQPVFGRGGRGRRLRPKAASPEIPVFGVSREVASPSIPAKPIQEPETAVVPESKPEPLPGKAEPVEDVLSPPLFGVAARKAQKEEISLFSSEPVEQPTFGKKGHQLQSEVAADAPKAYAASPGRMSAGPSARNSPCNSPVPPQNDDEEEDLPIDPMHPPLFGSAARKKEAERASTPGRTSTPLGKLSPRAATPTQPILRSRETPDVQALQPAPVEAPPTTVVIAKEAEAEREKQEEKDEEASAEEYEADFDLDEEQPGETSAIVDSSQLGGSEELKGSSAEAREAAPEASASGLELLPQTPKSSSVSQFSEHPKTRQERPDSPGEKPRSPSPRDGRGGGGQIATKPAPVAARPPPARKPPPDPDLVLSEKAIEQRAQLAFQATLRKALVNSTAPLPRALEGLPAMSLKNAPQMTQNIFLEMSRSEAEQWLKDEQKRANDTEARIAVQDKLAKWHEQREAAKQAEVDRKAKEEKERVEMEKAQYEKWKKRHEALQQKVAEWSSHRSEQQEKADREGVEAAKRAKSEEAKRRNRKKEENDKKIQQWYQEKEQREKEERAAEAARREREAQEMQAAEAQSKPKSGGRGKGRGKSRKGSRSRSKEAAQMRKSGRSKEAETTKRMPDSMETTGDTGATSPTKGEPVEVEESIGEYSENFESMDLGASTLAGASVSVH